MQAALTCYVNKLHWELGRFVTTIKFSTKIFIILKQYNQLYRLELSES